MSDVQEYNAKTTDDQAVTVKARQVDAEDGEDVTTTGGPTHVAKGAYLVSRDKPGIYDVYSEEEFNASFDSGAAKDSPDTSVSDSSPTKSEDTDSARDDSAAGSPRSGARGRR